MTRFERELSGELGAFWKKDAEKKIADMEKDVQLGKCIISDMGDATWSTNGRHIPKECAEVLTHTKYADMFDMQYHLAVLDVETTASIRAYKESMKNHKYSEEELFEMRSAFGEGATIVDVITGQTITL